MRHLRAKQGRKTLNYYRIAFGINAPYSVLLDGNFIHVATRFHIDIHARIRKQLGGAAYVLYVPSCVVDELEDGLQKQWYIPEITATDFKDCLEADEILLSGEDGYYADPRKLELYITDSIVRLGT